MKRELQISYAADRLWLKARWALMAIWALVAWGSTDESIIFGGSLFGALSGLVIQFLVRKPDAYRKFGKQLMGFLRYC